jgi:hypothetical protein
MRDKKRSEEQCYSDATLEAGSYQQQREFETSGTAFASVVHTAAKVVH